MCQCILLGGRRPGARSLAGIYKLGSQELTFAFVSMAPALLPAVSLVYAVGGYLGRRFASKSNSGRRQRRPRTAAWFTKRRMKRLLITQPRTSGDRHHHNSGPGRRRRRQGRDPAADGFVAALLSSLLQHAKTWQQPKSRLRKEFLESIRDLMRVVEMMWSCRNMHWGAMGPLKYPCE
jgi:hypothetical protein